jgi:endonuclease-3 related protein
MKRPSPLIEAYERLLARFGPQKWWPGESPFEVLVGAILVQNTSWKNVERALDNLREAGVLTAGALYALAQADLEELIRPAGYYRVKAKRLRNLLGVLCQQYGGSLDAMFAQDLPAARRELLAIHGVGPETADAILLYAGGLPSFVVDAYTHRIFARHGWIGFDADYHQLQEHIEDSLPRDAALFNEYHALLVAVGKQFCRKVPLCADCPLADMLPPSGPLDS